MTQWNEANDDRLIHELYQTMRAFSKTLNQEIAATGIYSSEWTVLNLIQHRNVCAQSELIEYLGVEPAAISKTLSKMEQKGVILRENQSGRRGKFIRLTEEGKKLFAKLSETVSAHRKQALTGISTEERETLQKLMTTIRKNLQTTE